MRLPYAYQECPSTASHSASPWLPGLLGYDKDCTCDTGSLTTLDKPWTAVKSSAADLAIPCKVILQMYSCKRIRHISALRIDICAVCKDKKMWHVGFVEQLRSFLHCPPPKRQRGLSLKAAELPCLYTRTVPNGDLMCCAEDSLFPFVSQKIRPFVFLCFCLSCRKMRCSWARAWGRTSWSWAMTGAWPTHPRRSVDAWERMGVYGCV